MLKGYAFLISMFIVSSAQSQQLSDISFGTDTTFDIATWNIEWFPKNGNTTIDSVSEIIRALDADIIACQEIDDLAAFTSMLNNIPNYSAIYDANNFEGLAYIYNTSTIEILNNTSLFTSSNFWRPFPRVPHLVEVMFNNKEYTFINNHYKCCGNGILDSADINDEENRRLQANTLLEQYINTNLPDDNVILLGDLNDLLTDNPANNVFQPFFNLPSQYLFTDLAIANGSNANWSYPSWPSHLDHILITDELFESFNHPSSSASTIKVDDFLPNDWTDYDNDVSDHRPVGLQLYIESLPLQISEPTQNFSFTVYPNPATEIVNIIFAKPLTNATVSIFDALGQLVIAQVGNEGSSAESLSVSALKPGVYLICIYTRDELVARQKFYIH